MAAKRTTFDKLQRERAKKAKAAAKRERRLDRSDRPEGDELPRPDGTVTQAELLHRIQDLHARYENEEVPFEQFEEEKEELLALLAALPSD